MLVVACRGYPGGSSQRLQGSWNRETEVICRSRKGLGSVVYLSLTYLRLYNFSSLICTISCPIRMILKKGNEAYTELARVPLPLSPLNRLRSTSPPSPIASHLYPSSQTQPINQACPPYLPPPPSRPTQSQPITSRHNDSLLQSRPWPSSALLRQACL
jgi:hypothetical protein